MTSPHPGREVVCAALELANRAPSLHNSQPWQWRAGSTTVHLYSEPALHLPHTDPDGRDLLVSCGAALHHSVVAFAALGWHATVHRFPDPDQPNHLAALQLHRAVPAGSDIALAGAIERRRTDRRAYSGSPVGLGDVSLMGARAARLGVTLRQFEVTSEFRAILAQAVWTHATDPDYLEELSAWSGKHASADGVPARNIPESDASARIPGRLFAGADAGSALLVATSDDGGALFALGTAADDAVARLRAGEATSAVLLTAAAQGLASCLMSEPLEVRETRIGLRELAFDGAEYPQMLARIGWPEASSVELPLTPRRPLADVLRRLDGTPYL